MRTTRIPLTAIRVRRQGRRPLGDISDLAASIDDIGLLQPIVVVRAASGYELVAGHHRVAAFRKLERDKIPAVVRTLKGLDRELAEIDENLIRNELTVLERAEHLLRRKRVYEVRHPEARHGGAPGRAGGGKKRKAHTSASFASATAKRLSKRPRTIQTDVQIATQIPQEVRDAIRGTRTENVKRDLLRLARLPEDQQRRIGKLLASGKAEDYGNAEHLEYLARIKRQQRAIDRGKAKMPDGVYEVIAIDPPWDYDTDHRPGWSTPYSTMTIEQIAALKIPTAKNAVVWLWTTQRHLPHAFAILERWRLRYVATMTWHKVRGSSTSRRQGSGKWLRMDSEFCLMGVKGKPKVILTTQSTVMRAQYERHSEKPDAFYRMVESLCVGRRLDMFARARRDGWVAFGAEV